MDGRIGRPLAEAYELSSADQSRRTAVLNYTDGPLNEAELKQVITAFSQASEFTGGKIYNRLRAIAMVPSGVLKPKDAGAYSQKGYMLLNVEGYRSPKVEPSFAEFATRQFPGVEVKPLQYIALHEMGHAFQDGYPEAITVHEPVLTDRGRESLTEDLADVFARCALGGDISQIPVKSEAVVEAVQIAPDPLVADPGSLHQRKIL